MIFHASQTRSVLESGIHPRWLKAEAPRISTLLEKFTEWLRGNNVRSADPTFLRRELIRCLAAELNEMRELIDRLRLQFADFSARYAHAKSVADQNALLLEFAATLGADAPRLRGDKAALKRWFGADALIDRYLRHVGESEQYSAFCLRRLGETAAQLLREQPSACAAQFWGTLKLEAVTRSWLTYSGDERVRVAAFEALSNAVRALPHEFQEVSMSEDALRFVYRAALDPEQDVWIQSEALRLLRSLSLSSFTDVLSRRLRAPNSGDDIFVRRRAVLLLIECVGKSPNLLALIPVAAKDPSPFVRQAVRYLLEIVEPEIINSTLRTLLLEDEIPQVRAATLQSLPQLLLRHECFTFARDTFMEALRRERTQFVQRLAIEIAVEVITKLREENRPEELDQFHSSLIPELERLHTSAENFASRRWAAQGLERIWCEMDAQGRELRDKIQSILSRIPPGVSKKVTLSQTMPLATLGRVLSVLTLRDFPYELNPFSGGIRVTRGFRFGFRAWRWVHELRHGATDKRQAFRHTIGRLFPGRVRAPSAILAELADTKVPGEPLQFSTEAGWRPYIPLVDEFVSALWHGRLVQVFSSEGVTEIQPPRSLVPRVIAWLKLTRRFPEFAAMRNWREGSPSAPETYLRAVQGIGFAFRFIPHRKADPAVTRFFPAAIPLIGPDTLSRVLEYFYSAYENSLSELAVFTTLAALSFFGRHIWLNHVLRTARSQIPMVLGGWGTRGKSGTERLKAALCNALGYAVVSKTTGCEAMILYAPAFGRLREMFLFRPYDKATIWEQMNVVKMSADLNAEVFLWECMALTPPYVRLLQRHWMRDDIATITNTFPDHEDLQGPAGINIPEVMTNFVPVRSTLITTEEQMRPILQVAADAVGTRLLGVGWRESNLITPDILARFPYQEHPDNIALVATMAEELGVSWDFALKEMADRVVPDLGVLKTSAPAPMRTRILEFANGMSANERFGALGNWVRLGFDKQEMELEPAVWVTTVVNNRGDRVPRSKVFAGMVATDLFADQHFLIGSNLSGLVGFIRDAWNEHVQQLTLWPESNIAAGPRAVLIQAAKRHRLAWSADILKQKLRAMLAGQPHFADADKLTELWSTPDQLSTELESRSVARAGEILGRLKIDSEVLADIEKLASALGETAVDRAAVDAQFRDVLTKWFLRKLIVVEDYYASGNQIITLICDNTPPGFRNRIMGVQNIKGTGLDFVYTWQAWDACHAACSQMLQSNPATFEQGLTALETFQDYNVLSEQFVRETISIVVNRAASDTALQTRLRSIESRMENSLEKIRAEMNIARGKGPIEKAAGWIEAFLDAGDAVRRRKRANCVFRDLAAQRISQVRAVSEMQSLTKRQKGGWFYPQLRRSMQKLKPVISWAKNPNLSSSREP